MTWLKERQDHCPDRSLVFEKKCSELWVGITDCSLLETDVNDGIAKIILTRHCVLEQQSQRADCLRDSGRVPQSRSQSGLCILMRSLLDVLNL
jgi:hypothetical protein